jgi:hypothetical protein
MIWITLLQKFYPMPSVDIAAIVLDDFRCGTHGKNVITYHPTALLFFEFYIKK